MMFKFFIALVFCIVPLYALSYTFCGDLKFPEAGIYPDYSINEESDDALKVRYCKAGRDYWCSDYLPVTEDRDGVKIHARWEGVIDKSIKVGYYRVGPGYTKTSYEFAQLKRGWYVQGDKRRRWYLAVPHGKKFPDDYIANDPMQLARCNANGAEALKRKDITRYECKVYDPLTEGSGQYYDPNDPLYQTGEWMPVLMYQSRQFFLPEGSSYEHSFMGGCYAFDLAGNYGFVPAAIGFYGCLWYFSYKEKPDGFKRFLVGENGMLVPDYRDGDWPDEVRATADEAILINLDGLNHCDYRGNGRSISDSNVRKNYGLTLWKTLDDGRIRYDLTARSGADGTLMLNSWMERLEEVKYPGLDPFDASRYSEQTYGWDGSGYLGTTGFKTELMSDDDIARQWPADYADESTMGRLASAAERLHDVSTPSGLPATAAASNSSLKKPLDDISLFFKPFKEIDITLTASCQKPAFSLWDRNFIFDGHCNFVAQYQSDLQAACLALWSLVSLFILFRA